MRRRRDNTPAGRRSSRAFTLAELLISMAVSAIVLSAAAALAFAVSHAWSQSDDINEVVNHGRNGVMRVANRIRSARAIGYVDGNHMLIWRADTNGDGYINQSELTLFHLDENSHRLGEGQYLFGSEVSQGTIDANNGQVSPAQFVSLALVQQVKQNPYYRSGAIAAYVDCLTWLLDADPPATRFVQMELRLAKEGLSQTLYSGMALRAPLEVE